MNINTYMESRNLILKEGFQESAVKMLLGKIEGIIKKINEAPGPKGDAKATADKLKAGIESIPGLSGLINVDKTTETNIEYITTAFAEGGDGLGDPAVKEVFKELDDNVKDEDIVKYFEDSENIAKMDSWFKKLWASVKSIMKSYLGLSFVVLGIGLIIYAMVVGVENKQNDEELDMDEMTGMQKLWEYIKGSFNFWSVAGFIMIMIGIYFSWKNLQAKDLLKKADEKKIDDKKDDDDDDDEAINAPDHNW